MPCRSSRPCAGVALGASLLGCEPPVPRAARRPSRSRRADRLRPRAAGARPRGYRRDGRAPRPGSRRGRFDLTIDLQGLLRSAPDGRGDAGRESASAWPMPARGRAGSTPTMSTHPGWACTPSIASSGSPRELGADDSEPRFNLPISDERPPMGRRRSSPAAAPAADHPQPRGAVAHQALAAGALRGDRPSRRSRNSAAA